MSAFTLKDWIILTIWVAFLALSPYVARRHWRHQLAALDRPVPSWWPYGGALWRGWIRAAIVATMYVVVGGPVYFVVNLWGYDPPWPTGFVTLYTVVVAGFTFVPLLLFFSVMLFSWPRFLIPPHLRDQPGAVSEWISGRRRRSTPERRARL